MFGLCCYCLDYFASFKINSIPVIADHVFSHLNENLCYQTLMILIKIGTTLNVTRLTSQKVRRN